MGAQNSLERRLSMISSATDRPTVTITALMFHYRESPLSLMGRYLRRRPSRRESGFCLRVINIKTRYWPHTPVNKSHTVVNTCGRIDTPTT